jgi:thiosulfate dehydrogenase [quinone] large subunit
MILVSVLIILAWRNAGWYGLDRWVLRGLGTPWHRGQLLSRRSRADEPEPVTTTEPPPGPRE